MRISNPSDFVGVYLLLCIPLTIILTMSRTASCISKIAVWCIFLGYTFMMFKYFVLQGGSNYGFLQNSRIVYMLFC